MCCPLSRLRCLYTLAVGSSLSLMSVTPLLQQASNFPRSVVRHSPKGSHNTFNYAYIEFTRRSHRCSGWANNFVFTERLFYQHGGAFIINSCCVRLFTGARKNPFFHSHLETFSNSYLLTSLTVTMITILGAGPVCDLYSFITRDCCREHRYPSATRTAFFWKRPAEKSFRTQQSFPTLFVCFRRGSTISSFVAAHTKFCAISSPTYHTNGVSVVLFHTHSDGRLCSPKIGSCTLVAFNTHNLCPLLSTQFTLLGPLNSFQSAATRFILQQHAKGGTSSGSAGASY